MLNTVDLYLGTFLVLSGSAISLLNLRRIVKRSDTTFARVLLSENILLTCIGIAFVSRSIYEIDSKNVDLMEWEEINMKMESRRSPILTDCNFWSVIMSYGPLIVSLVNSFLSLIIDNYLHYRMLKDMKNNTEDEIQEYSQDSSTERKVGFKSFILFLKKYFSFISIALQWIVPILMLGSMYPMSVKEMTIPMDSIRRMSDTCMAMLHVNNKTCYENDTQIILDFRKNIATPNYLKVYENDIKDNNSSEKIDAVVKNIYKIISTLKNNTTMITNITSPYLFRKSKSNEQCMKMCYLENRKLILYVFLLAVVSYFVPITISTMILTKIHVMDVKKPNAKTYMTRELLYNILFWTPVMLDTFLSLIMCSYSMNGMMTSLFNVIANVYQAMKNFMNTKYFTDNTVSPV